MENEKNMKVADVIIKVMQIILGILSVGSVVGICGTIIIRVNPGLVPFVKDTTKLIAYLNNTVFPSLIALIIFSIMLILGLELLRKIISELVKKQVSNVKVLELLKKLLIGEVVYGIARVTLELLPINVEENLISILPVGGNYIELIITIMVTYISYVAISRTIN